MAQRWSFPVGPPPFADSTAFTGIALADVIFSQPTVVFPPLLESGSSLEMWAAGQYTSTSATPTLGIGFYYGGASGGVALAATATTLAISASATAWPLQMYYKGKIQVVGTSGVIAGQGWFQYGSSLTAWNAMIPIPITAALRKVTIDTTATKALTVGAVWSSATGTPTLTINDFSCEIRG